MKMFKKSLSVILAVMMLFGCLSIAVFAENGKVTVSLRIEGINACLYYDDVTVNDGSTVLDVVKTADEKDDSLSVNAIESKYGAYINAINGITAGSYTAIKWDGWLYMVNGVVADVSVDDFTVSDGQAIVMYYGDPYVTGMQYPIMNTDKLSDGIVSFTSMDTTYDDLTWEPIVEECPVTGYKLTWGYNGKTVELTPDENGVCTIPYKYLTYGKHTVQIEKYDAKTGLPTVLRYAPDYSVSISFSDSIINLFRMIIDLITSLFVK